MASVAVVAAGGANMTTIQEQFKRHLQGGRFFNSQDTILAAVSTGVDSMVLLDLLLNLPQGLRPRIVVAHVNHELRAQSAAEEQFIQRYCRQHGLGLKIARWSKEEHPAAGTEEAGRRFRYAFFAQTMRALGIKILVTAHHQNDLAETILMKLVRGGQLDQLIGIADQRPFAGGRLVRPLLPFKKRELYAYAQNKGLKWYEDASNQDLAIERNRFRHRIIPELAKENSRFLDHLTAYRNQLQELLAWRNECLQEELAAMVRNGDLQLPVFLQRKPAQQVQLLRFWLEKNGVHDLKTALVKTAVAVLNDSSAPQKRLELPGHFLLIKDYSAARLQIVDNLTEKPRIYENHVVKLGQRYPIGNHTALLASNHQADFAGGVCQEMWLAPGQLPLTLRRWQADDRLLLKGGGHQKVSRVLINQKAANAQRKRQLVLVDAHGTVVWLVGRKWSWFARPHDYQQRWRRLFIGKTHRGEEI